MSDTAASMDWSGISRFAPGEWPEGALEYMSPRIITATAAVRDALPADYRMTPSPVYRGHVRHEHSGSRHATNGRARLSDATDIFMEWRHVWAAFAAAQRVPEIGGLGIYTDMLWAGQMRRKAMLHMDARPERLVWVAWRRDRRDPMKYVYLNSDPIGFFEILSQRARSE